MKEESQSYEDYSLLRQQQQQTPNEHGPGFLDTDMTLRANAGAQEAERMTKVQP